MDGSTTVTGHTRVERAYARHVRYALLAGAGVTLLGMAVYASTLSMGVAAADTYSLIEHAAIGSFGDLVDVLTTHLMGDVGFPSERFYRPLASLTFTLDHALWGLDPVGFHATNLLLYAGGVVAMFLFSRRFTHGSTATATLAAGLYATHPLLMDVVPAIERRQDLMVALFVLTSLTLHIRYLQTGPSRRRTMVASVACLVAALASKESALAAAPLFVAYPLFTIAPSEPWRERLVESVKVAAPWLLATVGWLVVRGLVVGGLGARGGGFGLAWTDSLPVAVVAMTVQYASGLFYPLALGGRLIGGGLRELTLVTAAVSLVAAGFAAWVAHRRLGRPVRAWPAALLAGLRTHPELRRAAFLVTWLAGGWAFCVAAFTMSLRTVTLFLPPLCLLLATGMLRLRRPDAAGAPQGISWRPVGIAALVVAVSLVATGPAGAGDLSPWHERGDYNARVLASVDRVLEDPAPATRLTITGHADAFPGEEAPWPPTPRNVWHLEGFTVASWLNLTGTDPVEHVTVEPGPPRDPATFTGASLAERTEGEVTVALTYRPPATAS